MTGVALLTHVGDIASAHVSNNVVEPTELPQLIRAIYASLSALGKSAVVVEDKRKPAVPIVSSVKSDAIICLECGAEVKVLKRHLGTNHKLDPADYKARWGLNANYPLIAPQYATMRREISKHKFVGISGSKSNLAANAMPAVHHKPKLRLVGGTAAVA